MNYRRTVLQRLLFSACLMTATAAMSGCHGGTLFGATVGALFGQAVGGNTESTVAGAVYGGIIGGAVEASHSRQTQHVGYYTYYPSYQQQHHHAQHSHCYDY